MNFEPMKKEDITWAPLIPLIGGFALGCEQTLGKLPVAILSYDGFQANDSIYVNHMHNTRGHKELEYLHLDNDDHQDKIKALGDIDIIVGVPPCAALSGLNTGKTEAVKGPNCEKNKFMTWIFSDAIDRFNPKVIACENAPALATKKGRPFADKLEALAKEKGYSFSMYETSTHLHGIPQVRKRTFALMWRSDAAPMMEYFKREHAHFADYLAEVPADALHQDEIIFPKLLEDPWFAFVKHHTKDDPRKVLIESMPRHITCFNFINKNGLLPAALKWFHKTKNEKGIKLGEHAKKKFDAGLGIWDGSVHVFDERMNAAIGRNLNDTIHPTEDRSMTIREAFHVMGFPHDFELVGGRGHINKIAQNVPVCTAADIVSQMEKFCMGELELSNSHMMHQNNYKEIVVRGESGGSLEGFM